MSILENIKMSKNIYTNFDEFKPRLGDIVLYHYDSSNLNANLEPDDFLLNGYIKAQIYDGKYFQHIDIYEILDLKKGKSKKKQKLIDIMNMYKDMLLELDELSLTRSYRGRYTRIE
jgi:hypothetical protein